METSRIDLLLLYFVVISTIVMTDFTSISRPSMYGGGQNSQNDDDKENLFSSNLALSPNFFANFAARSESRVMRTTQNKYQNAMLPLSRIANVMLEHGVIGRTRLGFLANIQYSRLLKQVSWLEKMEYIDYVFIDQKVHVELTPAGVEFAKKLVSISKSEHKTN